MGYWNKRLSRAQYAPALAHTTSHVVLLTPLAGLGLPRAMMRDAVALRGAQSVTLETGVLGLSTCWLHGLPSERFVDVYDLGKCDTRLWRITEHGPKTDAAAVRFAMRHCCSEADVDEAVLRVIETCPAAQRADGSPRERVSNSRTQQSD